MSDNTSRRSDGPEAENDDLHFVISEEDFEDGDRVLVDLKEREIAVFNVDGEYHAITNFCVHQGGPVGEGPTMGKFGVDDDFNLCYDEENKHITCPWHGWEFEMESGELINQPEYSLISHDTVVRDGDVYVAL